MLSVVDYVNGIITSESRKGFTANEGYWTPILPLTSNAMKSK